MPIMFFLYFLYDLCNKENIYINEKNMDYKFYNLSIYWLLKIVWQNIVTNYYINTFCTLLDMQLTIVQLVNK